MTTSAIAEPLQAPVFAEALPEAGPMRLAVLLNPDAGTIKNIRKMIEALQSKLPEQIKIIENPNRENIPLAISQVREFRPHIMGIAGGDGTAHHIINAYIQRYGFAELPLLLFLGGGSSNCVQQTFIPTKRMAQTVEQILRCNDVAGLDVRRKRLIRVNEGLYGFIAVTGYGGKVIHKFRESCPDRTPPAIARYAIRVIADAFTPLRFGIDGFTNEFRGTAKFDGVEHPSKHWFHILAGVVNALPIGLQFFRGVEPEVDYFKLAAGAVRFKDIGFDFWKFIWKKEFHDPRNVSMKLQEALFEFEEEVPITLDGEAVQLFKTIRLTLSPDSVKIVAGVKAS